MLLFHEQFLLFSTIFLHVVRFSCLGRDQIFTSDMRLFEISEVEIVRVNCIKIMSQCLLGIVAIILYLIKTKMHTVTALIFRGTKFVKINSNKLP